MHSNKDTGVVVVDTNSSKVTAVKVTEPTLSSKVTAEDTLHSRATEATHQAQATVAIPLPSSTHSKRHQNVMVLALVVVRHWAWAVACLVVCCWVMPWMEETVAAMVVVGTTVVEEATTAVAAGTSRQIGSAVNTIPSALHSLDVRV